MIRLVEGQDNKVKVSVASSIDTTGFSVSLVFGGSTKTITPIADNGNYAVTYSAADVAALPAEPIIGTVTILKSDSSTYQTMRVEVQKCPATQSAMAIGYQNLPIVLAANWVGANADGGGGGPIDPDDFVKKASFEGIANPKNSVNSNTETIKQILAATK